MGESMSESMDTAEYIKAKIAQGASLEDLLTIILCEVHNQMPHRHGVDHGAVTLGRVRPPAKGIDTKKIALVIEECLPGTTTASQLLTLAVLNLMGAVEWTSGDPNN